MKLSELKTSGHPLTLLCSFLYFDVSFMIWVMLGALGVYISQDFGLSSFEKGFVVALPILSGSVFSDHFRCVNGQDRAEENSRDRDADHDDPAALGGIRRPFFD